MHGVPRFATLTGPAWELPVDLDNALAVRVHRRAPVRGVQAAGDERLLQVPAEELDEDDVIDVQPQPFAGLGDDDGHPGQLHPLVLQGHVDLVVELVAIGGVAVHRGDHPERRAANGGELTPDHRPDDLHDRAHGPTSGSGAGSAIPIRVVKPVRASSLWHSLRT